MNNDLQGTVRHELEHILQEKKVPPHIPFPSRYMLKKLNADNIDYLLSDHETEAMARGFYRLAKTQKEKLDVVIQDYLNYFIENKSITSKQAKEVKLKWINYAKEHLPAAQYKKTYENMKIKLVKESVDEPVNETVKYGKHI
jgi:hypothetical protein